MRRQGHKALKVVDGKIESFDPRPTGEPNVFLREGEPVLVLAVVVDSHWRDKRLYKVKIKCDNGYSDFWVHARSLQEIPEA